MKVKIHPGFVTAMLVAMVALILYFGFGYLNNQPPSVTEARIAFYKNARLARGTTAAPKPGGTAASKPGGAAGHTAAPKTGDDSASH